MEQKMANFNMLDNATKPLVIAASAGLDVAGNPGVWSGGLEWEVDMPSIVSIAPTADELSVVITRMATHGVATITVTDGVVLSSFTVTIVPSEPLNINFTEVAHVAEPDIAPVEVVAEEVAPTVVDHQPV